MRLSSTVEDGRVVEVPLALCAQLSAPRGLERGRVGTLAGSSQFATGLNSLAERVEDADGRLPRDASVAVQGKESSVSRVERLEPESLRRKKLT